jgi:hypothetical protein
MIPAEEDIKIYISQLTEQERIVYEIAKEHLETSFDISRSIGFIEWYEKIHMKPEMSLEK